MWYYPLNGILFRHIKEQCTDICYNMNKPGKHYAKQRSQTLKATYYRNPLTGNVQNRQIYRDKTGKWLSKPGQNGEIRE